MADEPDVVYTAGTSTRTLEEFLDLLLAYGVEVVVDARRFPTSRRYPQFTRSSLEAAAHGRGMRYLWMGASLGGYRHGGYEAHMTTRLFQSGLDQIEPLLRQRRGAIICSERLPWRCHRRFIARALEARGWRVVHIIERDRTWTPKGAQDRRPGNQRGAR
jgi:uncharacterized protein (DUF488 family)